MAYWKWLQVGSELPRRQTLEAVSHRGLATGASAQSWDHLQATYLVKYWIKR